MHVLLIIFVNSEENKLHLKTATASHRYGNPRATRDHAVLPATLFWYLVN